MTAHDITQNAFQTHSLFMFWFDTMESQIKSDFEVKIFNLGTETEKFCDFIKKIENNCAAKVSWKEI